MKIKIGTKVISGFLVIVLLMLGLGIYSLFGQQQISSINGEIVDMQIPAILAAKNLEISVMDKVAVLRGYIITGDVEQISQFTYYKTRAQDYAEASLNLSLTEEGRQENQQVINILKEYDDIAEKVIELRKLGNYEAAVEMNYRAMPKVQEIKQLTEAIITTREQHIDAKTVEIRRINDSIHFITMLILGIALAISIVVGIILTRSITKPIKQLVEVSKNVAEGDLTKEISIQTRDEVSLLVESFNKMILSLRQIIMQTAEVSEQVAATSQQLSASSQETSATSEEVSTMVSEVANAASEQACAIEQSNKLIANVSTNIQQVSLNVDSISASSNETLHSAESGIKASQEVVQKMKNIKSSTEETSKVVLRLNDSSKEIEKIVDAIGAIAGQTNLLALNAAIEAARAGDAGRGFAVVAEEIRKLAEESSQSSNQIAQLILDIQEQVNNVVDSMRINSDEVEAGVEIVNYSNLAFKEIHQSIMNVVKQVNEVSDLAKDVTKDAVEITSSFQSMSAISQQTAASAQEVSAGAEEQTAAMEEIANSATNLSSMAEELSNAISIFRY
ncbi:methyl-accepting chemotaxis protein [Clostridium formicaceticum]|uniref:Methyl-accepting chemotaxis protein McpB n=1 Tax=Clostridium formicaceticum TaxID=1497 RepID=A0AAC9RH78_9CLOT|nr:methyl-accepting chemotaxis protein [Clostridium formicaceticum]AOY76491.1 hypothetical protein BJL90_11855 [Clostridium formicaceticum]ARE86899.1 Methyl-accepting chemotaxis protein McpB [Clostridium formicaceticum]